MNQKELNRVIRVYKVTIEDKQDEGYYTLIEAYRRIEDYFCNYLEAYFIEDFEEEFYPYIELENWFEDHAKPFVYENGTFIEEEKIKMYDCIDKN